MDNNEKKIISITITDISNLELVAEALDNLFREIITYYATTNAVNLYYFILMMTKYLEEVTKILGYDEGEKDDK
jgi:hypothetical protein